VKTTIATFLLILLVVTGCHSARPSEIVRQVEIAGSGDVKEIPVESLMRFFDLHARLAIRIETLCVTNRQPGSADWMVSDEGKICQAVARRDRVKYLDTLEMMKRMDMKDGDQNAASRIDEAEGK
jgi:hypothetical protein